MTTPNILFLQVDQLAAEYLKFYGDRVCQSPNLERLATEGMVFERAYCNFPLCAPSRFSMATGLLCSANGAYDNGAEMAATIPTYAHYLRRQGYQTALSGKMHFVGPDQFHGFEQRLTADIYPADFSWGPVWGAGRNADVNDPRTLTTSGVAGRTVQMDYDERVAFEAIQHLYRIARRADRRPFFLQVSFTHPHEPFLCAQEFWDLYEGADIEVPDALDPAELDPHSLRLMQDCGVLNYSMSDEERRRAIRAYYGSVSYIDNLIGQVLATLRSTGLDKNTVIVFTSDHGDMLGHHGMWFKKSFYDQSARVPLIISGPDIAPQRVDELVSLVDLLPTFMGIACSGNWSGAVEQLEGTDLLELIQKNGAPARSVYAEYLAESATSPIFMIRRDDWKFIYSPSDPNLLFNLADDPRERNNLADQKDYEDLVAAFQAEVEAKWNIETIGKQVMLSQKRRRLVREAMNEGAPVRWNHGEHTLEETPWYRGGGSYNEWALTHLAADGSPKTPALVEGESDERPSPASIIKPK